MEHILKNGWYPPSVYPPSLPPSIPSPPPPLGVHCEGPFINTKKKGAHREAFIQSDPSPDTLQRCYGSMDNVRIVTLAPELQVGVARLHILCFPPSSSFTSSLPPSIPCTTHAIQSLYNHITQLGGGALLLYSPGKANEHSNTDSEL